MADKKYCLELTFTQSTDGGTDNETLLREYSVDPVIHAVKTQIFTNNLTDMVKAMTKEFTDMAIAEGGQLTAQGKPNK